MKPHTIQPFYFPTTVALIDDSAPFLSNLSLQLNAQLAFRLFQSPLLALDALNGELTHASKGSDFFSLYPHREDAGYTDHIINVSLDKVHREVHNPHRFEQVSVVVVDYDMPDMNGLEFCQQIKNPSVKKILLTGKADEQIAVQAFNAKTIDRFIRKQDSQAMTLLNEAIVALQQDYFFNIEHMLSRALSIGSHLFLCDAVFERTFQRIHRELGIVEHYLTCAPHGILMLNAAGTAYLMLVQDEAGMQEAYEMAYDQNAPLDLLSKLRSDHCLPYFWKTDGHYASVYNDWENYVYPATEIQGNRGYRYAVIKNPAGLQLKYVLAYNDYLGQLDQQAFKPPQTAA